ncbi:MAG: hypothetical protein JW809_14230 [Pirellulales bacterium]|nr:hypothetical protein [Pirellulales bacterium]
MCGIRAWLTRGAILILASCWWTSAGTAEVVRVDVQRREAFADGHVFGRSGSYEKIAGRIHLEVDPDAACNDRIVDLKRAPRNRRGKVEFWTDFFLLAPADPARGNRRLFYDVNNRGNKLALGLLQDQGGNDPTTRADAGNGFLMRQGYAILWCGWNGDARPGNGRLVMGLPVAQQNGRPITGKVYTEVCVDAPAPAAPLCPGDSDPYPTVDLDDPDARLTMRPTRADKPVEVSRDGWAFARCEDGRVTPDPKSLWVKEGLRPGWLYELVYTAKDPRVTGLGLAAVRDVVSFFRHAKGDQPDAPNPLAGAVDRAYGFGVSQSGRFLQHFVYEGFNADVQGRAVFDAVLAHVPGAGRGSFNHRFAQTTRYGSQHEERLFPCDLFPFTSTPQTDPIAGGEGDTLRVARRRGPVPKTMIVQTSTEYWCRGASLLHTDVLGQRDVAPAEDVRIYFLAGAQHGVSRNADRGIHQYSLNTLDHAPVLRALVVAMDDWAGQGISPPPSRYPKIADGTLVDMVTYRKTFPRIPGVQAPAECYAPLRLDFGPRWASEGIVDNAPPEAGPAFVTLVPAVDADGNATAGIRLPDVAVPLGTFTGWNLRGAACGGEGMLARFFGAWFPLPLSIEDQRQGADPRAAILERYPSREVYLTRFAESALALARERFLLDEDVVRLLETATGRPDFEP